MAVDAKQNSNIRLHDKHSGVHKIQRRNFSFMSSSLTVCQLLKSIGFGLTKAHSAFYAIGHEILVI